MSNPGIVSISDVQTHLNLNPGDTSYRTELQGFIDAATEAFTYWCGPITPATFSESWDTRNTDRICVLQCPLVSVVSLVEYVGLTAYTLTEQPLGATVNNYGFSIDQPEAGLIVRRGSSGMAMKFIGQEVVVTYTAGRTSIPADIRLAALEDIRGLWQQTQQIGRQSWGTSGATDDVWPQRAPIHFFPRIRAIVDGKFRLGGIA